MNEKKTRRKKGICYKLYVIYLLLFCLSCLISEKKKKKLMLFFSFSSSFRFVFVIVVHLTLLYFLFLFFICCSHFSNLIRNNNFEVKRKKFEGVGSSLNLVYYYSFLWQSNQSKYTRNKKRRNPESNENAIYFT